ncbi:DUF6090 family protein [Algoriphagus sp. SE2]|uniref:DUF6090 family protein n=1 Tax=Algoriphagus sp. SE2 TaxID=3141536 RepID=UPI0031CD3B26
MEKNKNGNPSWPVGRYLKYAIGEIILVVIGILIALQINNWNEEQKAIHKQSLVLKELLNSINNDFYEYDSYLDPRLQIKKSGIDSLDAYMIDNKGINDSLFINFYNMARQDVHFRYGNGPFEALKSSGLDLIRNDSLRTHINNSYTSGLPTLVLFANEYYYETKPKIDELFYKLIGIRQQNLPNGSSNLVNNLKVDDVLTNEDFLWALQLEKDKYEQYTSRLIQIRTTLLDLKTAIEKELEE